MQYMIVMMLSQYYDSIGKASFSRTVNEDHVTAKSHPRLIQIYSQALTKKLFKEGNCLAVIINKDKVI